MQIVTPNLRRLIKGYLPLHFAIKHVFLKQESLRERVFAFWKMHRRKNKSFTVDHITFTNRPNRPLF